MDRGRRGSVGGVFVKICGVTNESDALLAVALGADALGFVLAPSPRRVAPDRARDIARRVPGDVLTVGVFRNELPERVVELAQRAGLRAVQLHGDESAAVTRRVAEQVPTVIKAFPAGHPGLDRIHEYGVDTVLVDGPRPGSGQVFDWSLAEGAPRSRYRVILAGGLDADIVASAIARVRPWGVDVSTGVEGEPGRKDPAKLRAFIKAARAAAPPDDDGEPGPLSAAAGLYDWEEED